MYLGENQIGIYWNTIFVSILTVLGLFGVNYAWAHNSAFQGNIQLFDVDSLSNTLLDILK